MKLSQRLLEYLHRNDGELIALHGDARLVRHLNGRYELRGGTPDDRAHIREWCSLFLHEAVIGLGGTSQNQKREFRARLLRAPSRILCSPCGPSGSATHGSAETIISERAIRALNPPCPTRSKETSATRTLGDTSSPPPSTTSSPHE